jgi:hypothetical protein
MCRFGAPSPSKDAVASALMNSWQQQVGANWGPPRLGPPQQSYPHPYPQQPYQHPGFPQQYPFQPNRSPGSGTAVTAIVLSLITAFFQTFAVIGYLALVSELSAAGNAARPWVPGFLAFESIVHFLAAAVLVAGAVLLIRRKTAGRWLTAGAGIALLTMQSVEFGVHSAIVPSEDPSPLGTLISVILPITIIIVALSGSTRRWLAENRSRR